jgi:hypothetical protein
MAGSARFASISFFTRTGRAFSSGVFAIPPDCPPLRAHDRRLQLPNSRERGDSDAGCVQTGNAGAIADEENQFLA